MQWEAAVAPHVVQQQRSRVFGDVLEVSVVVPVLHRPQVHQMHFTRQLPSHGAEAGQEGRSVLGVLGAARHGKDGLGQVE